MRTIFNILSILFVIISLYIVKDDLSVAYNKARRFAKTHSLSDISNLNQKIQDLKEQSDLFKSSNIQSVAGENLKDNDSTANPGPLVVKSDVLTGDIDSVSITKDDLIRATNRHRVSNSLKPFTENNKLNISSSMKVDDMIAKQYFEHISPTGVGVSDLGDQVGYEYIIIGENLALGNFKDGDSVLTAWMNSPGHRANILNTHYSEIGISIKKGIYEGNEVFVAVQHFGLPRSACPQIDSVLKGSINISQNNANNISNDLKKRKEVIDSGAIFEGFTKDEQIKIYNDIVANYNNLVVELKTKINKYNQQVSDFNNCLAEASAH